MVAVPRPATLLHTIADDVGYGAPVDDIRLEADEVPEWVTEAAEHDMTGLLSAAIDELDPGPRGNINELLSELMGDITADRLMDLRASLCAAMIDLASLQCRQAVKAELARRQQANDTDLPVRWSARDRETGIPVTGEL